MAIPCAFPRSLSVCGAVAPGSAGWTVDTRTPGGWTAMGPGLLLLQVTTQINIFLTLLRSYHIVLQKWRAGLGEVPCSACAPRVIDPRGFPAVQPVGSSSAQDTEVWMSSVTDTHPLLSLLYFHGTPCAECRFWEAVPQGQMDTDNAFPAHPCWIPPPLALGGTSGAQSHGKRSSPPWQSSQAGFVVCWGICKVNKGQALPAHSLDVIVYF